MSGKRFGTVVAVNGDALSVSGETGQPVWLSDRALFDIAGKVKLVCEARGLPDYVAPAAAALHS